MSECYETNPELDFSPPDTRPELKPITNEGREWPFFDPNNLPEINDIKLDVLKRLEPIPSLKTESEKWGELANPRNTIRYMLEAAEGSIDDNLFSDIFSHTVDEIRAGGVDDDEILRLYGEILDYDAGKPIEERRKSRILQLINRCNREKVFTPEQLKNVVKYCVVAATIR